MLTALNVIIYLGTIPLVLVVSMVVAVRKRHRLGPRASRLVVAGAAVLLVAHALTTLRPLLLSAVVDRDSLSNVAELVSAFALIHQITQAVGLGLLATAVFAARPQFANAGVQTSSE